MGQATIVARVACFLATPPASIYLPPSFRQNAIALSATLCQGDVLWRGVTAMTAAAIVFAAVNHTTRHAAPRLGRNAPAVQLEPAEGQRFADRWEQAERDSYQSDEAFWNGSEEAGGMRSANADTQDVTGAIAAGSAPKASPVRLSSLEPGQNDMTANAPARGDLLQMD